MFMNGKIHMKHLSYFWDPLNGYAEQHDTHEGIALSTDKIQIHDEIGKYLESKSYV